MSDQFQEEWRQKLQALHQLESYLNDEQAEVLMDSIDQIERLVDVASERREERALEVDP